MHVSLGGMIRCTHQDFSLCVSHVQSMELLAVDIKQDLAPNFFLLV